MARHPFGHAKHSKRALDINRTPPRGWEFCPPIPQVPSAGVTRIRKRAPVFPGARVVRDKPLVLADLYRTDTRPPMLLGIKPHHQCSICYNIKSHPVSCVLLVKVGELHH
ncbi:hypothetical protein C8R43DRAFT_940772 [Mycena crocata]|nr:hypothetical protein C8R43DRAFT_940772 [Mycena crocata]